MRFETALEEFQHIATYTEGRNSSQWRDSGAYLFVIWIDEGDEPPQPEHEGIQTRLTPDEQFEGYYKFSMILHFEDAE